MTRNSTSILALALAASAAVHGLADEVILKRSVRMRDDRTSITLADVAILDGDYAESFSDLVVGDFTDRTRPLELAVADIERVLDAAKANRARFDLSGNRVVIRPRIGAAPSDGPLACTPLAVADASTDTRTDAVTEAVSTRTEGPRNRSRSSIRAWCSPRTAPEDSSRNACSRVAPASTRSGFASAERIPACSA